MSRRAVRVTKCEPCFCLSTLFASYLKFCIIHCFIVIGNIGYRPYKCSLIIQSNVSDVNSSSDLTDSLLYWAILKDVVFICRGLAV